MPSATEDGGTSVGGSAWSSCAGCDSSRTSGVIVLLSRARRNTFLVLMTVAVKPSLGVACHLQAGRRCSVTDSAEPVWAQSDSAQVSDPGCRQPPCDTFICDA